MIKSFGDKATEALFRDDLVRAFQSIARPAKRKLVMLDAATRLADLLVPPSNRLEALQGDLAGLHAIRINDRWRSVFRRADNHAHEARVMDYH